MNVYVIVHTDESNHKTVKAVIEDKNQAINYATNIGRNILAAYNNSVYTLSVHNASRFMGRVAECSVLNTYGNTLESVVVEEMELQ